MPDRRSRRLAQRPFVRVAAGVVEHKTWLTGSRWWVYFVCLANTTHGPVWRGWTTEEVARQAGVSVRVAQRCLRELNRVSPTKPRRRYLRVYFGTGRQANELEVLHHIAEEPNKTNNLSGLGGGGERGVRGDVSGVSGNGDSDLAHGGERGVREGVAERPDRRTQRSRGTNVAFAADERGVRQLRRKLQDLKDLLRS